MSTRFNYIPNRVIDTDGISDGASVAFYLPGTTDLVSLYSDSAATVPVSNPYYVPAGAAIPPLYFTEESVRVRITTTSGDVPFDEDPWVPLTGGSAGEAIASTEFLYVSDYFEEGDEDDTAAFYRCMQAAAAAGKGVSFHKGSGTVEANASYPRWETGDYMIGTNGQNSVGYETSAGNLLSNVIVHVPAGVALRQTPNTSYMFYHNPVGQGTAIGSPHIVDVDDAEVLSNFRFINNGVIDGNVDTEGFAENVTSLFLAGVNSVVVEGTGTFLASRSDAIQIAPGDVGPHSPGSTGYAKQIHHCANVTIRDLTFDGLNQNNRNAISILDCDGLLIDNCVFKNYSRPGGGGNPTDPFDINTGNEAPGAIDWEPNYFSLPWITLRNNTVRKCRFENIGTSGVSFNLPHNKYVDGATTYTNTVTIEGFTVEDCYFGTMSRGLNAILGGSPGTGDANGAGYKILFQNNIVRNCNRPWEYLAGRSLYIIGNLFADCTSAGYVGYFALYGLRDFKISNNRFERCGDALGAWQMVGYGGEGWEIDGNEFLDCAVCAFCFSGVGTWTDGKIRWNTILPATAGAAKVMGSAILNSDFNGVAAFDNKSIIEEGNDWGGLYHFQFTVVGSRSPSVPAGDWDRNSFVVYQEAPPGEPYQLDCIYPVSGAADPDAWGERIKPGGLDDIDWTPSWTITKSANMTESADGRFTSTDAALQYAYTTGTLAASPGAEIIIRAPRSGWDGVYVGFSDAAAPTTVADIDYGVWFDSGFVYGVTGGALTTPDTSDTPIPYEWMQEIRVKLVSGTMTLYSTDPFTGVETEVSTGGGYVSAATRMVVAIAGKGQSVQITKFGAP